MRRHVIALFGVTAATTMFMSWPIEACGDKFMLPGSGLSFDAVYRARYPGAVLIYSPAGARVTDAGKLQAVLTRAGHKVTVVTESRQVASTASTIKADVVLTPLAEAARIGSEARPNSTRPSILPVLSTGDKAEKAACKQQSSRCGLRAKDSVLDYIVAVNATMSDRTKARLKGAQPR